jgi:hypothetical protein
MPISNIPPEEVAAKQRMLPNRIIVARVMTIKRRSDIGQFEIASLSESSFDWQKAETIVY